MPLDPRLYMTFPNDFWLHPKIAPLSDAAFRAFVEINGYSRMQDLDGRIPIAAARKHWRPRALAQLLANHPERPSLSVDGDDYVIWNYEQHQETKESRARRVETNRANGMKGGRPPKAKPTETQSVTSGHPNQKQSQSSESEIDKTDLTHLLPVSPDSTARSELDDPEFMLAVADVGIRDLPRVMRALERVVGAVAPAIAVDTARAVILLATKPVRSVEAYVEAACVNSPEQVTAEWRRVFDASPKAAA